MRSVHSDLESDNGAQPQRTMLSWSRTVLASVLGCAALAFAAQRQQMPGIAAVSGVAGAIMLGLVLARMRQWEVGGAATYALMRYVVLAVVVLALLGTAVAVRGLLG